MAAHEDPEVLALMGAPLAQQLPILTRWGMPDTGLLILMSSCDGRCFFCAHRDVTDMPMEMVTPWSRIEAWLGPATGATRLLLGGTEPASHSHFDQVLQSAAERGFTSVQLMTSGVRLAQPGTAERWYALGIREVCVPLYAARGEPHDAVVGVPGQFEEVVAGLDRAHAAGITVHVHTLVTRRTLSALPELADFTRDRWGARLVLSPLREKDHIFDFGPEAVSFAQMTAIAAPLQVSLAGFPRCVLPDHPRWAPDVIDVYFRGQRTEYLDPCTTCALRPTCSGTVGAHLRTFGVEELQPPPHG